MRVLVIRFSALGDLAMTIPVIMEALRQNERLEVDVLTRPFMAKLIPDHPRLRAIGADVDNAFKGVWGLRRLTKELKAYAQFDAVADLHYVLRSRVITRLMRSSVAQTAHMDKGREEKKALTRKEKKVRGALRSMTERYADVFRALGLTLDLPHSLFTVGNRSGIGFAPYAQHRGKSWPLDYARELLVQLNAEGQSVTLFGGPSERAELEELGADLDGVSVHKGKGLSSDVLAMSHLELMISMDSANMHMASLAGTPVISIWGATHPDAGFMGYGQSIENAVQIPVEELECRPCSVFGNKPCHRGDYACMNRISPDQVREQIKTALLKLSRS